MYTKPNSFKYSSSLRPYNDGTVCHGQGYAFPDREYPCCRSHAGDELSEPSPLPLNLCESIESGFGSGCPCLVQKTIPSSPHCRFRRLSVERVIGTRLSISEISRIVVFAPGSGMFNFMYAQSGTRLCAAATKSSSRPAFFQDKIS